MIELLTQAVEYKSIWEMNCSENKDFLEEASLNNLSPEDYYNLVLSKTKDHYFEKYSNCSEEDRKKFIAEWCPGNFVEMFKTLDKVTPGYIWHLIQNNQNALERAMVVLNENGIESAKYFADWISSGHHLDGKFIDKAISVCRKNIWTLVTVAQRKTNHEGR